ncbi:phytanoyl-CoA dioxygenase family protein [Pseudoalteromonas fenneropenaei]|uniref:Phytanoyl-CoA dioxygenase family protein n=1 Tax=Pseudoalteromonas fenneropenaei TaxID=1737459 RepID=A0ABV7CC46_9GAMM
MLSPEQLAFFRLQGYLHLPNYVSATDLAELQQQVATFSASLSAEFVSQQQQYLAGQWCQGTFQLFRANQLSTFIPAACIALGEAKFNAMISTLLEDEAVAMYDSLLVKSCLASEIIWHRDMWHSIDTRIITVGIYLDDAHAGQGALRVVPGTHLMPDELCQLEQQVKQGTLSPVDVAAKAGDVIIHDVNLLHCSTPHIGLTPRRTIYSEFRAARDVEQNPRYPAQWLKLRKAHQQLLQQRYTAPNDIALFQQQQQLNQQLMQIHVQIEAGHYCFHPPQVKR